MKPTRIRLTLDVDYDLNGVDPEVLAAKLSSIADLASGEGLMSGDTEATVESWSATVTVNPPLLPESLPTLGTKPINELKFELPTTFLGRNGSYKSIGLGVSELCIGGVDDPGEILIQPITSRGIPGRCFICVPMKDLAGFISQLRSFLPSQQKAPDPAVLIEVRGGNIQSVSSNVPGVKVIIRDQDNIAAGDADPTLARPELTSMKVVA